MKRKENSREWFVITIARTEKKRKTRDLQFILVDLFFCELLAQVTRKLVIDSRTLDKEIEVFQINSQDAFVLGLVSQLYWE